MHCSGLISGNLPKLFVGLQILLSLDVMCCLAHDGHNDDDADDDADACLPLPCDPSRVLGVLCMWSHAHRLVFSWCAFLENVPRSHQLSFPHQGECLDAQTIPQVCHIRQLLGSVRPNLTCHMSRANT